MREVQQGRLVADALVAIRRCLGAVALLALVAWLASYVLISLVQAPLPGPWSHVSVHTARGVVEIIVFIRAPQIEPKWIIDFQPISAVERRFASMGYRYLPLEGPAFDVGHVNAWRRGEW